MSSFVSFLLSFWEFLPWLAIAMMALLSLRKSPQSKSLQMQTFGAGAAFVVGTVQWVLRWLLGLMGASAGILGAMEVVCRFLLFISLAVFAMGYCLERFRRRGGDAVQVTARPVDG